MGTATLASSIAAGVVTDDDFCTQLIDPAGDAAVRRTDPGNDGALHPLSQVPDILSASVCGWEAFNPSSDPYSGFTVDGDDAHLFRLDLVIDGLANPPGGLFGQNPDPFAFGPTPLVCFLDIDVDDRDTGGELDGAAESRFLANIARFGRLPEDSLAERAARERADVDSDFYTTPQFERTGADFALVLCGCSDPTVVSEGGDGDGQFEEDETWIVRSRLLERSQGYRDASAAFGGSAPGLYDPLVDVRFVHSTIDNTTTVTVVWALDMTGAAALAGEPEQGIDLDVSNHTSVQEALQDIIDGADLGGFSGPSWDLVEGWEDEEAEEHLRPDDWELTVLVGVPYLDPADGLYVWTDTASDDETAGDCNGDEEVNATDESLIRSAVYANDGFAADADGQRNGRWQLVNPGWNFSLFDIDGDMTVEVADIGAIRMLADYNWDATVNTQDFIAFLNGWVSRDPRADFDLNGEINTIDFVAFLNAWVSG